MKDGPVWNEATRARLATLWKSGSSCNEIARQMGLSKNAVVGAAHRLNLPARPSPIAAKGSGRVRPPRRVTGPALPPLAPLPTLAKMPPACPPPAPARAIEHMPSPARYGAAACCWPIGEPGTKSFRFCDAAPVAGRPYCETHTACAYIKVRVPRAPGANP